jgi:hypothetical protein
MGQEILSTEHGARYAVLGAMCKKPGKINENFDFLVNYWADFDEIWYIYVLKN